MGRKSYMAKQRKQASIAAVASRKRRREEQNEDRQDNNTAALGKENVLSSGTPNNNVAKDGYPKSTTSIGIQCQLNETASTHTLDEAPVTQVKIILMQPTPPIAKCKPTQATPIVRRKLKSGRATSAVQAGRRVVCFSSLATAIQEISFHSTMCGKAPVQFQNERKCGLNMTSVFSCGCGKKFFVSADSEATMLPINQALVWGNTQSAIGFHASTSLLTTLEIPAPSYSLYKKNQDNAHVELMNGMQEEMKMWAQKEASLAIEAGEYAIVNNTKFPAITVILDGGWSKRSYRHSFSANCGIAVIIGARTGKVIYAATKTSTCSICDKKERCKPTEHHDCYKNWNGAPNGMETSLILEGFQSSMKNYNLVYWKFIGDGDSSVYKAVIDVYPQIQVEKVECTNHVCRNFTTRLMDISLNQVRGKNAPKISLEEKRLFNPTIPRFKAALRQAITHHHRINSDWTELRHDILNIAHHIFGDHAKCKPYFCKGPKDKERNIVPLVSKMELWQAIERAIERPASLAPSLIKKQTSNAAESFMSVCSKFLEGKRKNFGQRYLYRLRMAAAVFSYNESGFWAAKALKILKTKDPCTMWKAKELSLLKRKNRKQPYKLKKPLKIKKLAPPNLDYGDNPDRPDLSEDVLLLKIHEKRLSLQVTPLRAKEIEENTRDQSDSSEWTKERMERITASRAGPIYKLRDSSKNTGILNDIFRPKHHPSTLKAMEYGRINEKNAIACYEKVNNMPPGYVKKAGLFVYEKNGILGASPDGLVGDNGLLEVKCPYSLFLKDENKEGPQVWPEISKSSSLYRTKSGTLKLKRSHNHYFQIIMQLYCTGRKWCDYFVWSEHGHFCERIYRNKETDKLFEKMVQKFDHFWENDIAPELVDSRLERAWSTFKCPQYRLDGINKKLASKNAK